MATDPGGDRSGKLASDGSDLTLSQCQSCKHLIPGGVAVCDAFWGSIPQPMLENDFDHREPYDGDGGVRFEPRADVPEDYLARLEAALDAAAPHRKG